MKRIAILVAVLALFTSGAALAGTPDRCACPTLQTQTHGLTDVELAP